MDNFDSNQNELRSNTDPNLEHSDPNSKNYIEKQSKDNGILDTHEYKNDIDYNGEAENHLTKKPEDFQNKNHGGYIRNNDHIKTDDFTRTAGLSSDRCTRDFLCAKNRKYHRNSYKMKDVSTEKQALSNFSLNSNNNNNLQYEIKNSRTEYIFQSNRIMRNENRLRNMSHSDIFGNDDITKKRYKNDPVKLMVSETTNNTRDFETQTSNHQVTEFKDYSESGDEENRNKRIKLDYENSGNIYKNEKKDKDSDNSHKLAQNSNGQGKGSHEFDFISLKLSGLDSESSEKDLESLFRSSKLQIISIQLDRNIITHRCSGTAKVKVRNLKMDTLVNFQNLLKSQGINCKI